jgi:hypothetical protein
MLDGRTPIIVSTPANEVATIQAARYSIREIQARNCRACTTAMETSITKWNARNKCTSHLYVHTKYISVAMEEMQALAIGQTRLC